MWLVEEREVPAKMERVPVGLTVMKKGCGVTVMNHVAESVVSIYVLTP